MTDTSDRVLDPDAIVRDATVTAHFDDWDDTFTVEPLAVIVDAIEREANLHEAGRAGAGTRLRSLLAGYIGMQRDARDYPEILDVPVVAPIVVVGLPRSGTTLLHALLGADPAHRAPVWWEALKPSPPPDLATYATDPRRDEVQADFDKMFEQNPALLASLPYAADLVTECNTVMQPTLRTVAFGAAWHVPSYEQWYLSADQSSMYAYHRRALQQLSWKIPTNRWALKAPPHLFTCDLLVGEYPDAKLIEIHRDPAKNMASGASLFLGNRVLHADAVDPVEVGRDYLEFWALGNERMEAFRASRPDAEVTDVRYLDLVSNPIPVMRELYEKIGSDFTPEAAAAMQQWLVDNARDKRPEHKYSLDEFGLSYADIDKRFAAYNERYDVPLERSS